MKISETILKRQVGGHGEGLPAISHLGHFDVGEDCHSNTAGRLLGEPNLVRAEGLEPSWAV